MENMNQEICRLCLQTISGYYQMPGECLKNTFKLNLDISKEPVICIKCTKDLEVLVKFKSACVYTGEQMSRTDLKDMNLTPEEADNLISFMESKTKFGCCFCIKTDGKGSLTSLNESEEHKVLVDVLKEHIPKLNLNIKEELLICEICLDGLQDVLSFVMKCLDVEQKIREYSELKGTDDKGQIDLKDVQQFVFKPTIKTEEQSISVNELREGLEQFQTETDIKQEGEIDYPELFVKTEDFDIKPEHSESIPPPAIILKTSDETADISFTSQKRHEEYVNQRELTKRSCKRNTNYTCEICPYETQLRSNYNRHKLTHVMLKCELCPYETKRMCRLTQHKLSHETPSEQQKLGHKSISDVKRFKCEQCSYEAKRMCHLKQHKLSHKSPSELTMFKCELCPFEARHKQNLDRHRLTHKSPSEVTFKCNLCSYEAKRMCHLQQHKLSHKSPSELAMLKCDLCSYEAKCKDRLKRHKLIHKSPSDVVMFKCELCPYKTIHHTTIKRHILTHKRTSIPQV